ncbi:DUF2505 domain-containing protein [Nigerium massiliense]|uniref:DUF2505 domain-containing protein n=1 Tax=Nigerium massiliense TaxID=1522317 RepID=UPI0006941DD4|nr:DUF2505 domain-containing protein [Nigerium massiliense]
MELNARHHFNASPDRVRTMLTDRDFLAGVCERLGAVAHDVRVEGGPRTTLAHTSATVDSPGAVRAFVGPTLDIVLEMNWGPAAEDGSARAPFTMTVPGAPVTARGVADLSQDGDGAAVTYTGTLDVAVPLVGGRIEKQIAPEVTSLLDAQQHLGDEWLLTHP